MKRIIYLVLFIFLMLNSLYAQKYYFYSGKKYGSESVYTPMTLLLNAGFDIYQTRIGEHKDLFKFPYRTAVANVFRNLGKPTRAVKKYGVKSFIVEEVFPLTFSDEARWWPNYQLHLLGGGVTYTYLIEYFTYHKYDNPVFFAVLSYWSYHFCNEIVENWGNARISVDPVSDVYIFDLIGMFLFMPKKVRHFFSRKLNLADWSMQPFFSTQEDLLENNGQYFSLKWRLPFFRNKHWHLFYYWGLNFVAGLSYRFNNGYAISFGGGIRTKTIVVQDEDASKETILWVYTGGIFVDKYNSLLLSLIINYNYYQAIQLNIYPGFLPGGDYSPGIFLAITPDYTVILGVTFRNSVPATIFHRRNSLSRGKDYIYTDVDGSIENF